jgi:formylmethanofuran dehydrogenase subunit D
MTNTNDKHEFSFDEVFQEIPGDKENINMTIPPSIMEKADIKEGDTVRVTMGDNGQVLIEKVENGEEQ